MKKIFFIGVLFAIIFLCGCADQGGTEIERLKQSCIEACQEALNQGRDLSNGPCLLNPMTDNTDWVCDVAHQPRQPVDDITDNQCSAFRNRMANHFIEVDPNCNFIKSY